jgi:hypothetical protein
LGWFWRLWGGNHHDGTVSSAGLIFLPVAAVCCCVLVLGIFFGVNAGFRGGLLATFRREGVAPMASRLPPQRAMAAPLPVRRMAASLMADALDATKTE